METRQLAIITPDNEYYVNPTNYLIRGKFLFVHKNDLENNRKIILAVDSLVDVKTMKGERKALVFTASSKQYVLLFRSHGEDEIPAYLDDFDIIYKRNGTVFGDYVFADLPVYLYGEEPYSVTNKGE
jgi:hypothetical protein